MKVSPFAMALVAALAAAPAPAVQEPPAAPDILGYMSDPSQRMTVPVTIDGRGPYSFVVDTGSERTIISNELVQDLALDPGGIARVHSLTGPFDVSTAIIPELRFGRKRVSDIHAPAFDRRAIGAHGLLGIDSLKQQRVLFDFARQEMTITPARRPELDWPADTIVVRARSRFGHLVLVDASVEGQRVWVILDTGSQATVGNMALHRRLASRGRLGATRSIELMSVTGGRITAEQANVSRMRIGGIGMRNLPLAFADAHPFQLLDLTNRPAVLLGMDVLQHFDRVSVDFLNRQVRLLAPESSSGRGSRLAARAAAGRTAG